MLNLSIELNLTKDLERFRDLSMGGGGTLTYALHRPDLFSAAAPLSAATGSLRY